MLVIDEQLPREQWPLALIKEVRLGRDDRVRSVRLRLKKTELVWPITKLISLELP